MTINDTVQNYRENTGGKECTQQMHLKLVTLRLAVKLRSEITAIITVYLVANVQIIHRLITEVAETEFHADGS